MLGSLDLIARARELGTVVPAFNVPYLPMIHPIVAALRDADCFGLIAAARLEFVKFEAGSIRALKEAYDRHADARHTRLHLDHIPVLDEDGATVDYRTEIAEAVAIGYDSVMVDGSRLSLEANISATREVVEMARGRGIAVEAELGAVLGHADGPLPDYEELFARGTGFTEPADAGRFVLETGVNWLSVAVGSIHGAVGLARRDEQKVPARLDLPRLRAIAEATRVPLVLHGGSGIGREIVAEAVRLGIAKINIGTTVRQAYEQARRRGADPEAAVYERVGTVIRDELRIEGLAETLSASRRETP